MVFCTVTIEWQNCVYKRRNYRPNRCRRQLYQLIAPTVATCKHALRKSMIGPIQWGHSSPLCHALSLSLSSSWTSMRACDSSDTWWMGVRRLAVTNGPNIFQMLLVFSSYQSKHSSSQYLCRATYQTASFRFIDSLIDWPTDRLTYLLTLLIYSLPFVPRKSHCCVTWRLRVLRVATRHSDISVYATLNSNYATTRTYRCEFAKKRDQTGRSVFAAIGLVNQSDGNFNFTTVQLVQCARYAASRLPHTSHCNGLPTVSVSESVIVSTAERECRLSVLTWNVRLTWSFPPVKLAFHDADTDTDDPREEVGVGVGVVECELKQSAWPMCFRRRRPAKIVGDLVSRIDSEPLDTMYTPEWWINGCTDYPTDLR